MERKFRKHFFIAMFGIAVALFILLGAVIGSVYSSIRDGDEPNIFGFIPTVIISGSMEPTINVDSLNLYVVTDIKNIQVGDIVVFWSNEYGINIIHRAIEVREVNGEIRITTKGDANKYPDAGFVTEKNFIGELTHTFNWTVPFIQKIMTADRTEIITGELVKYLIFGTLVLWVILSGIYAVVNGVLMVFDQYYNKHRKSRR